MGPEPDFEITLSPEKKAEIESKIEKIGMDTKSLSFSLESFMRWAACSYDNACSSLDALIESHYYCNNFWNSSEAVNKVSKVGPENYLKVFKKLEEKLGYNGLPTKVFNPNGQIDNTVQLAKMGDKVLDIIDMLAQTGYALENIDNRALTAEDVNVVFMLMNTDLTKYSEVIKKLKETAGCKEGTCYKAKLAEEIIGLSNTNCDVPGAIGALTKTGFKISFPGGGIPFEISVIKEVAIKGPEKYLEIFTKLKEKFGYKNLNKYSHSYSAIQNIIKLLGVEGDVLKAIDVLAGMNYRPKNNMLNYPDIDTLDAEDIELITNLAKSDLEKFVNGCELLKNKFVVSQLNSTAAQNLLTLVRRGDDAFKVMGILADSGYILGKVGKDKWLSVDDVSLIRKLSYPKSLETFLQNLSKIKEIAGYTTTIKLGSKELVFGDYPKARVNYVAGHAYEILQISELRGDVWGAIDALVKSGYKIDLSKKTLFSNASLVERLAKRDISKYLAIFNKLKEKFDYKTVNLGDEPGNQVDGLIDLAQTKGDVCKAIDALAESGYKLATLYRKAWVCYHDASAIRAVATNGPENYLKVFKKLKEKLGYNTVRAAESKGGLNDLSYEQVQKIIEISQIPGNVCEIINTLAEWRNLDVNAHGKDNSLHAGGLRIGEKKVDKLPPWGVTDVSRDFKKYKIDKKKGLTDKDVQIIKYISDELWKKALENIIPCFYSFPRTSYKENLQCFIECFKSLSAEEKKKALKGVFNCKKVTNEEVIRWLDENEPELVREVGLSLV